MGLSFSQALELLSDVGEDELAEWEQEWRKKVRILGGLAAGLLFTFWGPWFFGAFGISAAISTWMLCCCCKDPPPKNNNRKCQDATK